MNRDLAHLRRTLAIACLLALALGGSPTAAAVPHPIALIRFQARGTGDAIDVQWQTAAELDVVGFRLLRSLRPDDLGSEIASVPTKGDAVTGADYSYIDTAVRRATRYYYWLEVIYGGDMLDHFGPAVAMSGLLPTFLPLVGATAAASFRADAYLLDEGECTVLRWHAPGAVAVLLDGVGVATYAVRAVCPASTTAYVLEVTKPDIVFEVRLTLVVLHDATAMGVDGAGRFYRGNPAASVKLDEFMEFAEPFSARHIRETAGAIRKNYVDTGLIVETFYNYPINQFPNSEPAAAAAYCAGRQAPRYFWAMFDWLAYEQAAWSSAYSTVQPLLRTAAINLGVDPAQYDACLASAAPAEQIERDKQAGYDRKVGAVPDFFMNKCQFLGAQPYADFQAIIEKARRGECEAGALTPGSSGSRE